MARTEKGIRRRDEIVEQVIAGLGRFDFKDATVRGICRAVRISVGTFYHYFRDKNDLMEEILGRIDRYLAEEVAPLLTDENELENLVEFGRGFSRYTERVGTAGGGVISTTHFPLPSGEPAVRKEHGRILYTLPERLIRRGQEKGQIAPGLDAEETADQLIISLRGQALEWSRRGRSYRIEDKVERFMRLFARMLRK